MTGRADVTVASIEVSVATVPTDGPEADGTFAWDSTTLVLVQARAGDRVGTGWTYAPAAAGVVVRDLLAPVVVGEDALAPAAAQGRMARAVRNAGAAGLVAMAVSAVDIALWDLCARLHELPLARMWGGPLGAVPVYGSGGFTSYDDDRLRAQLEDWAGLGLPAVKIKIGQSWGRRSDRDLHRTTLARETVGDGVGLFVDANGGYAVGQACRVGRELDALGVAWLEEPVSSEDTAGLRRVRESVDADVTAGEYGYDLGYFAGLVDGAVDCVQVDATRCGGYTAWLRVAALVGGHQLEVSGHCAPYVSAPVAAATPNLRHVEWFHDHVRIEQELFEGACDPVGGLLSPAEGPGHGLTLRPDVFEKYRVA